METFVNILKQNGVVGMPTETVYGLAGNSLSDEAVLKIYATKNRPFGNPLIIHVASIEQASKYGVLDEDSLKLAKHFWPPSSFASSLTLVVPLRENAGISKYVTAGLNTIAIRIPNHKKALEFLSLCNFPIAAPSANPSMALSPTKKEHIVFKDLPIIDGGDCEVGIESTIIEGKTILRPGIVTQTMLENVLKKPFALLQDSKIIKAPGMSKKHYAPQTPVVINSIIYDPSKEAMLGFGPGVKCTMNLSVSGDLKEAARNLFSYLYKLDQQGYSCIHIMPLPLDQGVGVSLNDKLKRMVG